MRGLITCLIVVFALGAVLSIPATPVNALDVGIDEVGAAIELGNEDPRTIIAKIINVAMLFLGIIAVIIILGGGFKWMTAAGNDEKVSEAKKLMSAGIIGLVIVLASWGIASFILEQLVTATA